MLLMALAVVLEPARTALVVLMLTRPRPILQLTAFLAGGFTICLSAGFVVLFVVGATPVAYSGGFTVARVHIAMGVFALAVAAGLALHVPVRTLVLRNSSGGNRSDGQSVVVTIEPPPPSGFQKITSRAWQLLQGRSLWVAACSGLFTLFSANYAAALAVILASGASAATQTQALVTFNVVATGLMSLPLVTYLVAPNKTRSSMSALHAWLLARRRRDVVALLAVLGCALVVLGVAGI